jgi:hypothetical protein
MPAFLSQKLLGLAGLRGLCPFECAFGQLRDAVEAVAQALPHDAMQRTGLPRPLTLLVSRREPIVAWRLAAR